MCVRSVRRDPGGRHESLLGGAPRALSRAYPAQTYSPSVAGDDTAPDAMRSRAAARLAAFPLSLIRETGLFVSSFGAHGAGSAVRQNLAMASSDPTSGGDGDRDVFGSLPNTRPQRRSAKRDRAGAKAQGRAGPQRRRPRRPQAEGGRRRAPSAKAKPQPRDDREGQAGRAAARDRRGQRVQDPAGRLRDAARRRRRRAAGRPPRHHRGAGRRRAGAHRARRRRPRAEVGAWTLAATLIGVGCRASAESSGT